MSINVETSVPFVLWYPEGERSQPASIAISGSVRHDGCRFLIIQGGQRHGWAKPGVMHIDDKRLEQSPERRREEGAWDFTDETKRYFELINQVAELKTAVAEIQARSARKTS